MLTSPLGPSRPRSSRLSSSRLGAGAALLTVAIALSACGQQTASTPSGTSATATTPSPDRMAALKAALKGAPTARDTSKWFIELSGDPTAIGTQSVGAQQATFRAQALAQGIKYQEVASFHTLFNGFSVNASELAVQHLSRLPGVLNVSRVGTTSLPKEPITPQTVTPQLISAIGMTGADYAQNELGLTGKGVKVGIIDTGLDLTHPAFAGRVVTSKDFVGNDYNSVSDDPAKRVPHPGPSVQDCNGHGTHVAGIVGGNDPSRNLKGVAPDVSYGIYRVFGCSGSADDDVILAAMEQAYKDGMQVVNMSLGSDYGWSEDVTARAASRMVKAGIVMSVSAGNAGTSGQYAAGSPASGDNVMAVASVDNVKLLLNTFTASSSATPVGYLVPEGSPSAVAGTTLSLTKLPSSTTTTANDGCTTAAGANPYSPGSLTGKAVLIQRGTCSLRSKALNAQAAGASAVLIYNNTFGLLSSITVAPQSSSDTATLKIPVADLQQSDGSALSAAIQSGTTSITFNAGTQSFDNPTGNTLSNFSSYGMSPELELKPDLAAPGGSIRSAYPLALDASGVQYESGTSMSAPHAAGVAALLLQFRPSIQAKDMRGLLMNTSVPRTYLTSTGTVTGYNDYVQQQGAGMINVPAAAAALSNGVSVTPSKLSLGASATFGTRSEVLVLHNDGDAAQTYQVSNVPALTLAGTTFVPKPSTATATMSVNGSSVDSAALNVTVAAHSSAELNVVVTPPAGAPDKSQYGGYVVLQNSASGSLRVPYAGFVGNYQSIQVLGDVAIDGNLYDFPLYEDGNTGDRYEANQTAPLIKYTFATTKADDGSDIYSAPVIDVNFAHPARRFIFDLLDDSGNVVNTLATFNYWSPDPANTYEPILWDGTLADGTNAPNGNYKLRIRVLKALGNENNPADTETYTSPLFTVARP